MVVRMLICAIVILLCALVGLLVWKWMSRSPTDTVFSKPVVPVETGQADLQHRSAAPSDTDMDAIQKEIMSFTAKFVR